MKPGPKTPNPIDQQVGSRVRMRRMLINMSQEKLGQRLGITFQQVQKYEKGTNRIGASRLQQISNVLGMPIGYFFDGASGGQSFGDDSATDLTEFLKTTDGRALVRAFSRISDVKVRRKVLQMVQSLASATKE